MSMLKIDKLGYTYEGEKRAVLQDISYEFEPSTVYAVTGKSGAGKTTLLSLLSGLATPTQGSISLNGENISKIDKYKYRSRHVGVVFQSYNLLPKLTALENIILSMDISGRKYEDKKAHAAGLLAKVGLEESEMGRRILKLSGGQQQRVAIARALSYDPQIILADEPTGNLDSETQREIMGIFQKLAHEDGKCIIIVTHSAQVAEAADKIIKIGRAAG